MVCCPKAALRWWLQPHHGGVLRQAGSQGPGSADPAHRNQVHRQQSVPHRLHIGVDEGIRKGHAPKGKRPRHHRGLFLDLKALAYALLGEGLAADKSCRTFGVTDRMAPKPTAFSAEVVDVLLQRANAMQALYSQLLNEYKRLAVSLPPWEAYSPASIGKQYLREIGVRVPQLVLDPSLPAFIRRRQGHRDVSLSCGQGRSASALHPCPRRLR